MLIYDYSYHLLVSPSHWRYALQNVIRIRQNNIVLFVRLSRLLRNKTLFSPFAMTSCSSILYGTTLMFNNLSLHFWVTVLRNPFRLIICLSNFVRRYCRIHFGFLYLHDSITCVPPPFSLLSIRSILSAAHMLYLSSICSVYLSVFFLSLSYCQPHSPSLGVETHDISSYSTIAGCCLRGRPSITRRYLICKPTLLFNKCNNSVTDS